MGETAEKQKGLRQKLAEGLGMDPEAATNDELVVTAMNEALAEIETAKEERLAAAGVEKGDPAAKAVDAAVENELDVEKLADDIRARAEEIRKARLTPRNGPDLGSQAKPDMADAAKAGASAIEQINKSGGLLPYVRQTRPVSIKELMQYETGDEKIRMLQRANDDILFTAHLCGAGAGESESPIHSVRDLRIYDDFRKSFAEHTKAMDTTEGAAWAPTVYSYDLQENVYQSTAVARIFPRMPWIGRGSTLSVPVEGTDITMYGATEPTSDGDDPKYTVSDPGLGDTVTVTAKTLAARSYWSLETEEDFIIEYLPHLRMKFVREFARGFDEALLDGDNDGTHQDTGLTLTATDRRELFSGLRKKAIADTTTATSCATYFNFENVMTPTLLMGAYAVSMEGNPHVGPASGGARLTDTVLLTSHALRTKMTALRDTRNNNIWLTPRFAGDVDGRGQGYGAVSFIGGYQIIPSAKIRSDLTTAGIYDGSTKTCTQALWVYCPAWHIYDKRQFGMTVVDKPEQGQRVLIGTMRLGFQHMYTSGAHTTSHLYGMVDTAF